MGLRRFSDVIEGVSPGACALQHVWGSQLGLSARIPAHGLPPGFGFLTACLGSSMNVPKIPGRGWVAFYDLPPEFHRDSIGDAQVTDLCRFEERKAVSCFLTRICMKSCGHLGKYADFLNHFMKSVLIFLGYISSLLNETYQ